VSETLYIEQPFSKTHLLVIFWKLMDAAFCFQQAQSPVFYFCKALVMPLLQLSGHVDQHVDSHLTVSWLYELLHVVALQLVLMSCINLQPWVWTVPPAVHASTELLCTSCMWYCLRGA